MNEKKKPSHGTFNNICYNKHSEWRLPEKIWTIEGCADQMGKCLQCKEWHRKIKKKNEWTKWKRATTLIFVCILNWIQRSLNKLSESLSLFSITVKNIHNFQVQVGEKEMEKSSDSGNYWPQVHFTYYIIFWNCI